MGAVFVTAPIFLKNAMKPKLLLTNDDGIQSPALSVAENVLRNYAETVTVVAPDRERSASSHAITMHSPLRVERMGDNRYSVDGTPADCVYLGATALCEKRPEFVISGPNKGPNLGTDVFYSGTVAAAAEGYLRGLFGIALSAPRGAGEDTWVVASKFAGRLVTALCEAGLEAGLLNVNFPAAEDIKGYRWTRLGRRTYREEAIHRKDPKGRSYYWIGGPGLSDFEGAVGEDVEAVMQGYISLTPLKMDMTEEKCFSILAGLSIESFRAGKIETEYLINERV